MCPYVHLEWDVRYLALPINIWHKTKTFPNAYGLPWYDFHGEIPPDNVNYTSVSPEERRLLSGGVKKKGLTEAEAAGTGHEVI